MSTVGGAFLLLLAAAALTFHPARPLYMRSHDLQVVSRDGTVLSATLSSPRWARARVPAVVLVHGSGRLARAHVRGDVRGWVREGFAVLAYDKRGVGRSTGSYPTAWGPAADSVLGVLADDAAAAFDSLRTQPAVDAARVGFFGASQASWIIPLAAPRASAPPRFQVILSGAAVSTGEEALYSHLTSDGTGPPRAGSAEIRQRLRSFDGAVGFNPRPLLGATRVPTLWLLGEEDRSVPTFRTAEVLDSLSALGNASHTVIRYPGVGHDLRDVGTGRPAPVWTDVAGWLRDMGSSSRRRSGAARPALAWRRPPISPCNVSCASARRNGS